MGCKSQTVSQIEEIKAIGQSLFQLNSIEYSLQLKSFMEYTNDTMTIEGRMYLEPNPNDSVLGMYYYFTSADAISFYNGEHVISLYPNDSTGLISSLNHTKGNHLSLSPYVELSFGSIRRFLNTSNLEFQLDSICRKEISYENEPCIYFSMYANDTLIDTHKKFKNSKSRIELIFRKKDLLPVYYSQNREIGPFSEAFFTDYSFIDKYSEVDFSTESVPDYYKWNNFFQLLPQGTVAPNWHLPSIVGDTISLENLKGKYVLIEFWFMGCGVCIESIPILTELTMRYPDEEFEVIGINCYSNDKVKISEYCSKFGMEYTNVWKGDEIRDIYQVKGAPIFYLINPDGVIIYTQIGHDATKLTAGIENHLSR